MSDTHTAMCRDKGWKCNVYIALFSNKHDLCSYTRGNIAFHGIYPTSPAPLLNMQMPYERSMARMLKRC